MKYVVTESCEDYCQFLTLKKDDRFPEGGLLTWQDNNEPYALFNSRSDARKAITRTDFYRKSFGLDGGRVGPHGFAFPDKKYCRIERAIEVEGETPEQ